MAWDDKKKEDALDELTDIAKKEWGKETPVYKNSPYCIDKLKKHGKEFCKACDSRMACSSLETVCDKAKEFLELHKDRDTDEVLAEMKKVCTRCIKEVVPYLMYLHPNTDPTKEEQ